MATPVYTPCPISTCGITRVVVPVLSMRMNALGANLPLMSSGACSGSLSACAGRLKASKKPPAAALLMNSRRDVTSEICLLVRIIISLLGDISGGTLDGLAYPDVRAAATDVASHGRIDVGIVGSGRPAE